MVSIKKLKNLKEEFELITFLKSSHAQMFQDIGFSKHLLSALVNISLRMDLKVTDMSPEWLG